MLTVNPGLLTELLRISPSFQLISNVKLTSNTAEARPSQSLNEFLTLAHGTLIDTWLLEACLQTSACFVSHNNSIRFPLINWFESAFYLQLTKDMIGELKFRVNGDKSKNGMVITLCNISAGDTKLASCKSMYRISSLSLGAQREK